MVIIGYILIGTGGTIVGIGLGMLFVQWLASSAIANTDFLDD